jgi:ABC-2 type transport system permease protein
VRGLAKLTWVELKLFTREPLTLVFTLAYPLIVLFVLAEVFGNSTADRDEVVFRNVGAVDYYVPAYVALVAASIGLIALPVHLTAYRERGVLRRLRASGLRPWKLVGAHVGVCFLLALAGAILVMLPGRLVYGAVMPEAPLATAAMFVLVTLTFAAVGVFLGAVMPTARAAQAAGMLLFFVMIFVCGAGPPPEVLSEPLRRVADGLPLTHAIRVLQDPWLGFSWSATALAALAAFLLGSAALSLRFFRWQ